MIFLAMRNFWKISQQWNLFLNLIINQSEEILDDFGTNTTESVIVGTDRLEVLNRI